MIPSFTNSLSVRQHLCGAGFQTQRSAFTLVELLVVISIIGVLTMLVIPSITSIKGGGDVTKAAYDVSGALENARSFAIANNTYVWVGFYEEDGSKASTNPATSGTGRVVISTVASKDGTMIHDPSDSAPAAPLASGTLSQLNKLIKIENAHLASLDNPLGTGSPFDSRPAVGSDANSNYARIGDSNPPTNSKFPFQYPLAGTAQYNFVKTIQFNPRGENKVDSTYGLKPVVEIGLQPTHGNVVDANNKNVVAIQITGVGGNVTIYRR